MPQNKQVEIRCKHKECYWNLGLEYVSNCSRIEVRLTDNWCLSFITEEEAKKRLKDAALRK